MKHHNEWMKQHQGNPQKQCMIGHWFCFTKRVRFPNSSKSIVNIKKQT